MLAGVIFYRDVQQSFLSSAEPQSLVGEISVNESCWGYYYFFKKFGCTNNQAKNGIKKIQLGSCTRAQLHLGLGGVTEKIQKQRRKAGIQHRQS